MAVGVLWVLTVMLTFTALPRGDGSFRSHLLTGIEPITVSMAKFPTEVKLSVAALAIYLLGVAATVIGDRVARLLRALFKLFIGIVGSISLAVLLLQTKFGQLLFFLAFLLLVAIVVGASSLSKDQGFLNRMNVRIRNASTASLLQLYGLGSRTREDIASAWNPERRQIEYFRTQDLSRRIDVDPGFIGRFVERMQFSEIARALNSSSEKFDVPSKLLHFSSEYSWDAIADAAIGLHAYLKVPKSFRKWLVQSLDTVEIKDPATAYRHLFKPLNWRARLGLNDPLLPEEVQAGLSQIRDPTSQMRADFKASSIYDQIMTLSEIGVAVDAVPKQSRPYVDIRKFTWRKIEQSLTRNGGPQFVSTEDLGRWLVKRLSDLLNDNERYRRLFLRQIVDSAAYTKDLERRTKAGQIRLRVEQSGLFDLFDRLKSEAEFRVSLSLPLAISVSLLWLLLTKEVSLLNYRVPMRLKSWLEPVGLQDIPIRDFYINVRYIISVLTGIVTFVIFTGAGKVKDIEASAILYSSNRYIGIPIGTETFIEDEDFTARPVPGWLFR
ncbi:hypothetical protein [Microlunatus antarcticus]|uniref:Uncharacterized protein n=1 Tax=Microlunatus antarcticus TaxID=53388 RepID=A0A7W5P7T5_9ACTN|nr:hypothetical protein [Microlunatus antarcticus]MBB3327757.1 hypothetical protein [Microlunatus antarcticus]